MNKMTDSVESTAGGELTLLLRSAADGDVGATERFTELVYEELERLAEAKLFGHYGARAGRLTLEPAALVNESLIKLLRAEPNFENRRHFFSFISSVMTRVMLDYQRRRSAEKRGGDQVHVTLTGIGDELATAPLQRIEELLVELEALDERKARVVRLRAIWGLDVEEVAELLEVSPRTVERDWRFSRGWLGARLGA